MKISFLHFEQTKQYIYNILILLLAHILSGAHGGALATRTSTAPGLTNNITLTNQIPQNTHRVRRSLRDHLLNSYLDSLPRYICYYNLFMTFITEALTSNNYCKSIFSKNLKLN